MAQIMPSPLQMPMESRNLTAHLKRIVQASWGYVYIVLSLAANVWYLTILAPYAKNDLWWPHFNTTGLQSFLADAMNAQIACGATGTVDLFAITIHKTYWGPSTSIHFRFPQARHAVFGNLSLESVVTALRNVPIAGNLQMGHPLCWADFQRRFELAHTAKRQIRCNKWTQNAAMYLEPLLRNVLPNDTSTIHDEQNSRELLWLDVISSTVYDSILDMPSGNAWVNAVSNHVLLPINDEVAYWTDHGMTHWRTQAKNDRQATFKDTIDVWNALGVAQQFTIGRNPLESSRSLNQDPSTSHRLYVSLAFDMLSCLDPGLEFNCTLIRNHSRSLEAFGTTWDEIYYNQDSIGSNIVRATIGPLGAIDTFIVSIPEELSQFFVGYHEWLASRLLEDATFASLHKKTEAVMLDPVPPSWRGIESFGGSLLCPHSYLDGYIRAPFNWGDNCEGLLPLTVQVAPSSALFALTALQDFRMTPLELCQLCVTSVNICEGFMPNLSSLWAMVSPAMLSVDERSLEAEMKVLNASLMQLAITKGRRALLVEPLIQPNNKLWSFYGWVMVHQWLEGKREVYSFQGDEGSMTLISDMQEFYTINANALELTHVASDYILYANIYISVLMLFVGVLTLVLGITSEYSQARNWNLFHFNRVAGSVWVGRPFLLLRGLTAMVVLCVSPTQFFTHGGMSWLERTPRHFFKAAIVAGETTWFSYAMQDLILPLTKSHAHVANPISVTMMWLITFLLEVIYPFRARVTLDRTCHAIQLGVSASCTNGVVVFGSHVRLLWLCCTHAGVTLVSTAASRVFRRRIDTLASKRISSDHKMVPASAQVYLIHSGDGIQDNVINVLYGILPFRGWLFDIKLWVFVPTSRLQQLPKRFRATVVSFQTKVVPIKSSFQVLLFRVLGFLGLFYMAISVSSSYYFIDKVKSIMANDFYWKGFNATAHQTFIANFFTVYLQCGDSFSNLKLDSPLYGDTSTRYGTSLTTFNAPKLYPVSIQDEVHTLMNVIQALRRMDGCFVPWIFTSFCYVDFNQTWEMAATKSRQVRCQEMTSNGAVFLESVLRNAEWETLDACWGPKLEISVFSFLKQSNYGKDWILATRNRLTNVEQEQHYWQEQGILLFRTQWQNFKNFELVEQVSVRNAFGVDYPFTIKNYVGDFHVAEQTSFILYWGLANDLWSHTANTSWATHGHLIRQSPQFVFTNDTFEEFLAANYTLVLPLGAGLSLTREFLGPFGTIDAIRIACPAALRSLYQNLTETIALVVNSNSSIEQLYMDLENPYGGLVPPVSFRPRAWMGSVTYRGGDLLCDAVPPKQRLPGAFFSSTGGCMSYGWWYISPPSSTLKAVLADGLIDPGRVASVCLHDSYDGVACQLKILYAIDFLLGSCKKSMFEALYARAQKVAVEIRDILQLDLVQFLSPRSEPGDVFVSPVRFFSSNETNATFFMWQHLFEWVEGRREVVRFHGDRGSITLLSKYQWDPRNQFANPTEIPRNFSLFTYRLAMYISSVLLFIACVACIYIVLSKGYVEGLNMTQFNRVAGAVWIGRPLMLARGCIALCLLSTAALEFSWTEGMVMSPSSGFASPVYRLRANVPETIVTLLSASEVNWIVYLINDVFTIFTQEYSYWASTTSAIVAWAIAALWSLVSPVEHTVEISRQCTLVVVDFEVTCSSGTLEIGRVSRLLGLLGVAHGASFFCYLVQRIGWPTSSVYHTNSKFLCSVARYNFTLKDWELDGVVHLDRASALLNGMLSFRHHSKMYVFDIKTWRLYALAIDRTASDTAIHGERFANSIPLAE